MTIYPQQNYNEGSDSDSLEYEFDLEYRKKAIAEATEIIKKELVAKWQTRYANVAIFPKIFEGVNQEMIDFLLSFKLTLFYDALAKKCQLDKNQRDVLPHIIWDVCQKKSCDQFASRAQKEMKISKELADQINDLVQNNILAKAKELSEKKKSLGKIAQEKKETQPEIVSLPFAEMLKKYPEINDQLITSDSIKLINNSELVRPTLKNWINDYTLRHGYKKHTTVERGSFLFQSENGRKLSPSDREKLSQIIKSFDQESGISIEASTKKIIFQGQSDIKNISVVSKDKK
jgi:DNA replication protein DnaD